MEWFKQTWVLLSSLPAVGILARWFWNRVKSRNVQRELGVDSMFHTASAFLKQVGSHFVTVSLRRRWIIETATTAYADRLLREHSLLITPGIRALPVESCYTPLDLRSGGIGLQADLLGEEGAFLLQGDPGSGKSALLSYLITQYVSEIRANRRSGRLPVYVSLDQLISFLDSRRMSDGHTEAFSAFEVWFESEELKLMRLLKAERMLTSYATDRNSGLVVMLDGLDELDPATLRRVEPFILRLRAALSTQQGRNLLIVASRQQGLAFTPNLTDQSGRFSYLTLEPYTDAAIYSFIARWMNHNTGEDNLEETSRIFAQIRNNPSLHDTCRSPLALVLYLETSASKDAGAAASLRSETRAGFLNEIVEHLVIRRRAGKGQGLVPNRAIANARMAFFVEAARDHIGTNQPLNHLSEEALLRVIPAVGTTTPVDPVFALQEVAKDTGILKPNADGTWGFIHSSFLDYFSALSMQSQTLTRNSTLRLLRLVVRERLRMEEPFFLLCGIMAANRSPSLEPLLATVARDAQYGHLYPRACLEAESFGTSGFVENIKKNCERWREDHSRTLEVGMDVTGLQVLVQLLIEYEDYCSALSATPAITVSGEFGALLEDEDTPIMALARLDVKVAARLLGGVPLLEVLSSSDAESSITALYDQGVASLITDDVLDKQPRLGAILAECALRSSLIAASLVPSEIPRRSISSLKISWNSSRWEGAWPIRNTLYAHAIGAGISYLEKDLERNREFPRLALLARCRPQLRQTTELIRGDWRRSILLLTAMGGAWVVSQRLGSSWWLSGITSVLTLVGILAVLQAIVRRDHLILDSMLILNRHPGRALAFQSQRRKVRFVRNAEARAETSKGTVRARGHVSRSRIELRYRKWVFRQQVFDSVTVGHSLPLSICAAVMEKSTEDIRQLVGEG